MEQMKDWECAVSWPMDVLVIWIERGKGWRYWTYSCGISWLDNFSLLLQVMGSILDNSAKGENERFN